MPTSISVGPFSPPDADPQRSMMDSNRNSIEDIRRNHAARAAKRQSHNPVPLDYQPSNGLVPDAAFTPIRGHGQYSSEAASVDQAQRNRRAMTVDAARPASVIDNRAARIEAVQRHQQHSRVAEGSSDAFDAADTLGSSSRDTHIDRASQQQLQLRAAREQQLEQHQQQQKQQQQILRDQEREREHDRQRERDRLREKERERERDKEKERSDRDRDRERRSRRMLGDYALGKTLGAGSMGKVKLGVKMGNGEKVAIKIIPRHTSMAAAHSRSNVDENGKPQPPQPTPTASFLAKAAAKDQSKEIRTIREGSLQILLHHPYVCGMREMIIHTNHYYMVFEYVNGGQMLDYIISHGRLRERSARKFARQIGSALEYCHRNSIVHRDLKIENILISKTGNIKIIDFGLSNLFSPHSHLSTFCGSLYFAAPELLNAKVYTGPEVDVWSFGIVLYVLVCGKVPFDDQSMPALHAKIKRGQVEYPAWLSGECKHILSRMLVTNPANRATLAEILAHPWMVKGYEGAPDPHLPDRTPLRPNNIDPEVIKGMTGFEFGTPEAITAKLMEVLTSEPYQTSLYHWEIKNLPATFHGLSAAGHSGSSVDSSGLNRLSTRGSITGTDTVKSKTASKRFSGIDFYKKKLTSNPLAAAFGSKDDSSLNSANGSSNGLGAGTGLMPFGKEPLDPTRGFHPLISIYFLVKEKMERERLYGHSFFASSNLSLNGPPAPPAGVRAGVDTGSRAAMAGAMPTAADIPQEALRVPEAPHVSHRAYDRQDPALVAPAPPRPAASMMPVPSSPTPVFESRENMLMSRSPSSPLDADVKERKKQSRMSMPFGGLQPQPQRRASAHNALSGVEEADNGPEGDAYDYDETAEESLAVQDDDVPLNNGTKVRRSGTLGDMPPSRAGARHTREVSLGAVSVGRAAGLSMSPKSSGTARGNRGMSMSTSAPLDKMFEDEAAGGQGEQPALEQQVSPSNPSGGWVGPTTPGQAEVLPALTMRRRFGGAMSPGGGSQNGASENGSKPIFLKGLFSVQTTSTKPRTVIHASLVKVLDRIGVQYREIRGGYECVHLPSLDFSGSDSMGRGNARIPLEAMAAAAAAEAEASGQSPTSEDGRQPKRKPSRLSFVAGKSKDRAGTGRRDGSVTDNIGAVPAGTAGGESTSSKPSLLTSPRQGADSVGAGSHLPPSGSRDSNLMLDTIEGSAQVGAAGAKTMNAANATELAVRFEIFVVKVPLLLGVNGLQFRRVGGNPWQYQMLAKRILQELKL
uniref:non-specific serine/threonine protein kinase n=1 Tax=Kalmanozyma brasiliensis (strain GHG001) TaxID=1365824 RepID=V5EL13_KALBG